MTKEQKQYDPRMRKMRGASLYSLLILLNKMLIITANISERFRAIQCSLILPQLICSLLQVIHNNNKHWTCLSRSPYYDTSKNKVKLPMESCRDLLRNWQPVSPTSVCKVLQHLRVLIFYKGYYWVALESSGSSIEVRCSRWNLDARMEVCPSTSTNTRP